MLRLAKIVVNQVRTAAGKSHNFFINMRANLIILQALWGYYFSTVHNAE